MEIKRKTNILVRTSRRYIIRQTGRSEAIYCEHCTELMIPAQTSADFFGVSSRVIYRLIELENIHFVETDTNEIYVCQVSVKRILETDS